MSTVNVDSEGNEQSMEPDHGDVPTEETLELEFTQSTLADIDAYASHSGVTRGDAVRRIVRKHFEQIERRTLRLTAVTAGIAWIFAVLLFGSPNIGSVIGAIYIVVTLIWASYPLLRTA